MRGVGRNVFEVWGFGKGERKGGEWPICKCRFVKCS